MKEKENEENEEKKGKHIILEIQDSILGNRTQKSITKGGFKSWA